MATAVQGSFVSRTNKIQDQIHLQQNYDSRSTTYEPTGSFQNNTFLQ